MKLFMIKVNCMQLWSTESAIHFQKRSYSFLMRYLCTDYPTFINMTHEFFIQIFCLWNKRSIYIVVKFKFLWSCLTSSLQFILTGMTPQPQETHKGSSVTVHKALPPLSTYMYSFIPWCLGMIPNLSFHPYSHSAWPYYKHTV